MWLHHRYIYWVYQYSRPVVIAPKDNTKFEILLVKIFKLKQKTNQMLSTTLEKNNFFVFKKTIYGSLRQGIVMEKQKPFKQI